MIELSNKRLTLLCYKHNKQEAHEDSFFKKKTENKAKKKTYIENQYELFVKMVK